MKEIDIIYPETIKIRLCGRDIEIKPLTIGEASRISGVNPADVTILIMSINRK